MPVSYAWRGPFHNAALNALHAEAFHHHLVSINWWTQVNQYSLGWVCAQKGESLVGFVNVAWDGGIHTFLLDTIVASRVQRQGIGTELVAIAIREARTAGCEWLHVDFEDHLRNYYIDRCGFRPTHAGLIAL